MTIAVWFVLTGALLVSMALAGSFVKRLPLSSSMLYLIAGVAIGPAGAGLLSFDPIEQAELLELLTETVVIISLFVAGLKLRLPLRDPRWRLPLWLASGSMALTIAFITITGMIGLGLSIGAALLLGAILAPTDPVLASDVQVEDESDRDRVRFGLTGEAGLNDGAAFPFVMLALGLLHLHQLGTWGWRWLAIDVAWAVVAGLGIGGLLGTLVGQLVLYLRREHREAEGLDDFLALGLIAVSYGLSLLLHAYGFLAVFAAGLALRMIERRTNGDTPADEALSGAAASADREELATNPETAPAFMANAVLHFTEPLERFGEVALVVLLGVMLVDQVAPAGQLWLPVLLLVALRPLAVLIGLAPLRARPAQRALIAWFGVRGIGSLYYLAYAIAHGLPEGIAGTLTSLTVTTVALSIVLHGVSVTPLMRWYQRRNSGRRTAQRPAATPVEERQTG